MRDFKSKFMTPEEAVKAYLSERDQAFTHIGADGTPTSYAISDIYRELIHTRHPIAWIPIEPRLATMLYGQRDALPSRANSLTRQELTLPLLFALQDDGTHLLIDGTHRYLRFIFESVEWAPAFILDKPLWSRFTIPEITKEVANVLTARTGKRIGLKE